MKARKLPHVRALDGVRGLAALAVLAHHTLFASLPPIAWPLHVRLIAAASGYGVLGVDLFFVLSGYLITSLLLLARRRPNYFHNFYWKRVFRILPPLVLTLAITHVMGWTPWSSVAASLLFVANFTPLWRQPENGPFWSLSIEEQFYLLWPSVVRRARPRSMFRLLVALIIGSASLRALSVLLHHGRDHYTFVHCDGIACGAFLALLAYRARLPYRSHTGMALWKRAGRPVFITSLIALACAVVLEQKGIPDYDLQFTAAAPLFAAALLYLLTHRRSLPARLLASAPLVFLGDVSYMVYLSHPYFMMYYDDHVRSWMSNPTETGLWIRFLVILGVTLAFCTVSLYAFERPVGRLRRYFLRPEA